MRAIGVDWGGTRIGWAVGEREHRVATARSSLQASGSLKKDAEAIAALAKSETADLVVVGVPEGAEDERQARLCRTLAANLEGLGLTVVTVDESLTSVEADSIMVRAGLTGAERRKRKDGEAACRILERWFDT